MWDYISEVLWFSDISIYLEDYLIYKHNTLGVMSEYDSMLDLKMKVGHCYLYFMIQ